MLGNSIRIILRHPARAAAAGILVACVFSLVGLYFLTTGQSGIRRAQNYFSRAVQAATTRLGVSAAYGDVRDINPTTPPARKSFCLSDASVQYAKSAPLIWFNPSLKGGAHTWIFNGAEVIKGLTAFCGDSRLNAEVLAQIRNLLDPAKGPTATGGYQDQKQLGAALMFFLTKRTPEIWNQLSTSEQALIDLNVEALTYSSTFTTKDMVASQLGMNGDTNLNRDWNPNYQNGMVGMIIVTALYWGFDEFEAKLAAYDHTNFLNKLRAYNMKNLLSTYANPATPSGAVINAGLRKIVNGAIYRFHDITERNVAGLFNHIASRTFSATISCGLNNGSGIGGFGKIAKNCDLLPNLGRKGMMLEFASSDAEGPRSSAMYNWDAWYPLNYSRVAMQITGWLTASTLEQSETWAATMDRYGLGSHDLWYKISPEKGGGYLDYEHGRPGSLIVLNSAFNRERGAVANFDLFNVLQRNLGMAEIEKNDSSKQPR
jgi:hypothetical protein